MREIYLDSNATSRPLEPVSRAVTDALSGRLGNPASAHAAGHRAAELLEETRDEVSRWIGAKAGEIVFTSGGTEANNLALKGIARAREGSGFSRHAVTSGIEHPSVLTVLRFLEQEAGWEITVVPPEPDGTVDPERVAARLRPRTGFCSIMLANNEVGTLLPVREIAHRCRELGVPIHTDAAQAVGRIPVDVEELSVDLLTFAVHKTHGPPGAGALFVRPGVTLMAQQHGGEQERGLRAGTENVAALAGLRALVRGLPTADAPRRAARLAGLRDRLESGILGAVEGCVANGGTAERLPNTSSIRFPEVEGRAIVSALALEGVAASQGAACSAGDSRPSHVLQAMGLDRRAIDGSVRFSVGLDTTEEEIDLALARIPKAFAHAREYSAFCRRDGKTPFPAEETCCRQPLFPI